MSLRCPRGIAPQPAIFPAVLLPILSRLDGTHSLEEIAREGSAYGVTLELLENLVKELDALNLLDSDKTQLRWNGIKNEYRKQEVRDAALAGAVYPKDPEKLGEFVDEMLHDSSDISFEKSDTQSVVGFMCPHIDYRRGRLTYGTASRALEQMETPDIVVLFGTSHQYGEELYRLSRKDFAFPGGVFSSASAVFEALTEHISEECLLKDELTHRTEHSLELQLPLLAHHFSDKLPSILPVLVGSFHEYLLNDALPGDGSAVDEFVSALTVALEAQKAQGKRILLYSGVDFAHMGLSFGDQERVSDTRLEEIEERDREMLSLMLDSDTKGLFEHIAEDNDRRRVCGFPSVYTMLEVMKNLGMELDGHYLEYRQAVEPETDTVVTFASACWTEERSGE